MDKDNNSNVEDTRQTEDGGSFNTIFDDVFRTIAQKMPSLLIPLINEVFGTKYVEDQEFEQLRNEHYEKFGKIITDSIIRIGGRLYHIECQSGKDGDMALRMVEYDFAIALEHSCKTEDDMIEINFPESCVLYIRNHRDMPDHHEARVRFADGQMVTYKVPIIMAQDYTVNNIFEKRLLALLPYHILRYEHFLKSDGVNQKKLDKLLDDYQNISEKLTQIQEMEGKAQLYINLIDLIKQITDYVIPKENPVRERIGAVMGGRILQLASERLIEEGRTQGITEGRTQGITEGRFQGIAEGRTQGIAEGRIQGIAEGRSQGIAEGRTQGIAEGRTQGIEEGRVKELYSMVQDGGTTLEYAAKRLQITVSELRKKMLNDGYQFPEN